MFISLGILTSLSLPSTGTPIRLISNLKSQEEKIINLEFEVQTIPITTTNITSTIICALDKKSPLSTNVVMRMSLSTFFQPNKMTEENFMLFLEKKSSKSLLKWPQSCLLQRRFVPLYKLWPKVTP